MTAEEQARQDKLHTRPCRQRSGPRHTAHVSSFHSVSTTQRGPRHTTHVPRFDTGLRRRGARVHIDAVETTFKASY